MGSRDRSHAARTGAMRPPSAPPTSLKRKERDFEESTGDETNINVVVRCRGRSEREVRENSGVVVSTQGAKNKSVELSMGPNAISNKTYHFDKVYSPAADQAIIFEDTVAPILGEMLSGYNCTIFAYGQTGTGKTYTMSGDMTDTLGLLSDNAGIIPRVLYALFAKLENDGMECSVKCSFIELYNEELRDLLSPDDTVKLKIFDDARKSHVSTLVQGMEETYIVSATEGIKRLQEGSYRRQVAATKCNDLSSRSHTVFTISTHIKKPGASGVEDLVCSGKLNLVDLAGSENIQRSGAENKRAAEAGLINKSLLTLGRVINALVDKSAHIPYRESKLTRLLQDSLGGRTKTCIIATVSPAKSNLEETISTLDYAFRAKNIRNKPQVNSMVSKKTLLREFTSEIEKLKSELIATRQRNGVYLTNEQYEEVTTESESRRILSEEQKARIETMEASLRNKVQELFNVTNNFANLKKDNEATRVRLQNTNDVLEKTKIVLDDTERNLSEETDLRKAHQATEVKLRKIGTQLIATAAESTRDLDGVYDKLRRRSELHHQNQDAWISSAAHVTSASTEMDTRIAQIKDEFATQLVGLSTRLQSFISDEIQRTSSRRADVHAFKADFQSRTGNIEAQSLGARDDMNEVLEEIKDLREDVKSKVGEGLRGLSDAAARISAEVISELDQFHLQLNTSYSGLARDFKQLFEEIAKELATQRSEADQLRHALHEANRKNMQSSLTASTQLGASLEAERKAAQEDKAELMHQISLLIAGSQRTRDERLSKSITSIQDSIANTAEEIGQADKTFSDGMDNWNVRDAAFVAKVNASRDILKSKMQTDWTAVESKNSAIQASTRAVHQETVKIVEAQVADMAKQMEALDEFVSRARCQNDSHHEARITNLSSLTKHATASFDGLEKVLEDTSAQTAVEEAKTQIATLADTLTPIDSDIRRRLQSLRSHLNENGLQEYTATGETPQRRIWTYPTTLPQTVVSTTPPPHKAGKSLAAQTPSRTKSPRKTSPRKQGSPRKVVKEVYIDSPINIPPALGQAPTSTKLHRSLSARSVAKLADQNHTLPLSSLKEVDINTGNHTISFPISNLASTTETEHKREKKQRIGVGSARKLRSAQSRSKKDLSVSVHGLDGDKPTTEKENFQPSKSVSAAAGALLGMSGQGKRLRSSPLSAE